MIKLMLMALTLYLGTLSSGATAELSLPKVPNFLCPSESLKELGKLGASGHWIQQVASSQTGLIFRSPTRTFGRWVELRIDPKGLAEIFVVEAGKSFVIHLDQHCGKKKETANLFSFLPIADSFTDSKLQKIVESKKAGLIYVWSPRMVYSMEHFKQFEGLCRKLKIEFFPVMDSWGSETQLQQFISQFKLPKKPNFLASVELYMRGIQHHPISFVYAQGKLSLDPIIGVMTDEYLQQNIENRFAKLFNE